MRPSQALKVDQTRTVWPSRAQEPIPRLPKRYDPTLRWDASTGGPDSVHQPAREEESERQWLLRCWEWVLRQRYYWIVVFVSMFVCMVVLLIGGWRPLRKRQVKVMEGAKEESKAKDDVLAENPNDSPTLAHDKAEWREIRSRLLLFEYGDSDKVRGKEQDMLRRITFQQNKRAERRAVFAFLWFGGLVGGWGGLGGYYVYLRPWGNWEDLLWVGCLVVIWGFFVFEVGDIVAVVWLREKRVDFPPAMKPRGGWGSRVFEMRKVRYPVLLEEKVSGSILQYMMKLFRRWVLVEGRQRGLERWILYNTCLEIRDTIELDIAERRETHNTGRFFADIAVQGTTMGELCESPLEDIVAVRDAIGDDRVPIAERVVGRPRGVERRKTRQRQMGTEAESSTRRVTRSMAKEMEVEISSETTDVNHSNEGLVRSRARGRNVWSSGQIRALHDLRDEL